MHELAIGIKIWHIYGFVLQDGDTIDQVMQTVVDSLVRSPIFLEPKIFILMELFYKLQYEHIDAILTSIETRFGEDEEDEDGSNSYLLCNLNPIKTACHMLMLLDLISQRYSMASLRTDQLSEDIITQARSVLDKLFFPRQMKF